MSKYQPLWEFLKASECRSLKLSFAQIEEIAKNRIDHSFLQYKKELAEYGYRVGKISQKMQTVEFFKIG